MLKKVFLLALTGLATCITLNAADTTTVQPVAPNNLKHQIPETDVIKVSEAFGHFIGRNLNTPGIKFDLESIVKGMREGAAGKPAPLSDKEYEQLMAKIQENAFALLSQENLKAANEFLSKNAKETGIVEIQPGKLQYLILKEGTGPLVTPHSSPQINYVGKFIDGSSFGSSEEAGGPITIPLDQTIQGFSLGIAGMKEGEKRKLFVHPELGYGTSGHLPPNALLIFEIEVVKASSAEQSQTDEEEDDLPPLALASDNNDDQDSDDDDDEDENEDVKNAPNSVTPSPKNASNHK